MIQQNLRVKNPSVTLYAFHLHTEMAKKEAVTDVTHLWEKLAQLGDNFSIPELQALPEKLICYQYGKYSPVGEEWQGTDNLELIQPERELRFSSVTQDNLSLSGSVYPLRLHDTYAVDFTLSYKNQELTVNQLRQFNPQGCLMPSNIQASLGQTLLLYAEPLEGVIVDQHFAEECVKALLQDAKQLCPSMRNQGKLFGSSIFEYEIISKFDAPHPNESTHILVWLGEHEQTLELATLANRWLINLLNCRHKVLFACHQAHQSNHSARQIDEKLDGKSQQLNQLPKVQEKRIELLEALLNNTSDDTFEYAHHIRHLADHHTTIKTNTTNYAKWLGKIRELSLTTDNLTFLDNFYAHTCHHHQQQIGVHLDDLELGHHLFGQMMVTILGMVHIGEQKQQIIRDQKFEFLITFIGVAVGTGAISAVVIPEPPNFIDLVSHFFDFVQFPLFEMPQWFNNFPAPPNNLLKVIFHLMVGGVTAVLFTPLISFFSKRLRRKSC
jgi:hypothetical protein